MLDADDIPHSVSQDAIDNRRELLLRMGHMADLMEGLTRRIRDSDLPPPLDPNEEEDVPPSTMSIH